MYKKSIFLICLFIFILFNITIISATDFDYSSLESNSTNDTSFLKNSSQNITVKDTPKIILKSTNFKSKDVLNICLKDSKGNAIKFKKLTAVINNKKYSISTNSKGIAPLKINLAANKYKLNIYYKGDNNYNLVNKTFNIKISKLSTKIIHYTNFVIKGKHLYLYLHDKNGDGVSGKHLTIKLNGKTYTKTTNKNGRTGIKIKLSKSKYLIKTKFKGDNQFKSSSDKFKLYVISSMSLNIGNSILLTNGYLRIYLKDAIKSNIWKKNILIKISNKKFSKKTNSEGIIVFKPKLNVKLYKVTAKLGKYYVSKKIKCIEGNVKDPLKEKIPLKNSVPNIDYMPGNYVNGDSDGTYTLKKSQYLEVIRRDSYCLFLNNKLSKYTFFKTKSHPNLKHIIKREKWNVIERAINTKIVKANKHSYWPGLIKVSLKGKSYNYPEVKDVQNTGYTCGPTSASMCSQVLKNYVCEKYLAKLASTSKKYGTKCSGIKKALEKNNFNCTYFYKNSFNYALKELKHGGCALVFHTKHHYVAILDISKDSKKVLVSNSYGNYYNIPTKWLTVKYMKTRFVKWDDSLIVRLNYSLSKSTRNSVNSFYSSMGANWNHHSTHANIG